MYRSASIARRTVLCLSSAASRRALLRQGGRRLQTNSASGSGSGSASSSGSSTVSSSHLYSGLLGGGVVLAGVYGWYHFSGVKTAVATAQSVQDSFKTAKSKLSEKAPNANEALRFLRQTAQSYAAFIPGAKGYIDSAFDGFDELAETHGDEVNGIVGGAYQEIRKTVQSGAADTQTAGKILEILKRRLGELEELGRKVGGDVIGPILEKHPEVKEKLGGGWDELRDLANKRGPEAKKILDDVSKQVQDIFKQGFSAESVDKARQLVQEKTQQLRELGEGAAKDAWEKAQKEAEPYLDKVPQIKELLQTKSAALIAGGVSTGEVFGRIKELAEKKGGVDEKKVEELKGWLEQKAAEAQKKGSDMLNMDHLHDFVKAIPGGQEALEKVPALGDILQLSKSRSEDAKKLAEETYRDILKLLEEKVEKARKLAEEANREVKEKAKEKKGGK